MKTLKRLAALVAVLVLALPACSALGYKFETPQLSVVGVELVRGDLAQQQLRVRLHVVNPNRRELPVSGIDCEIEVAGEKFAHGESEREFVVPPQGEADFDMLVSANAASTVLRIATGGFRGDKLEYRLIGTVKLGNGLLRKLPFEHRGSVALR
jgi:LEA14-like dessication related protein